MLIQYIIQKSISVHVFVECVCVCAGEWKISNIQKILTACVNSERSISTIRKRLRKVVNKTV